MVFVITTITVVLNGDTPNGSGNTGGGNGNISCDNVTASINNGKLSVSGLGAPIVVLKVFDSSWRNIFECTGAGYGK